MNLNSFIFNININLQNKYEIYIYSNLIKFHLKFKFSSVH